MEENRFEVAARETGLLDPRCIRCDYNLRDNTAGRCPECGLPFDPAKLVPLAIPWMYRRQIGSVRAYRQTLWFMMRRGAKLKYWTDYPLDPADTWAFARWTRWILFAMATAVVGTLVLESYRMWPSLSAPNASVRPHLVPLWKDPVLYTAIWWWLRPVILLGMAWAMLGLYLRLGALTTSRSDPNRERNALLSIYNQCGATVMLAAPALLCFLAVILLEAGGINAIGVALLCPVLIVAVLLMGLERTGTQLRDRRNTTEGVSLGIALLLLAGVAGLLAVVTFLMGDVIESLLW